MYVHTNKYTWRTNNTIKSKQIENKECNIIFQKKTIHLTCRPVQKTKHREVKNKSVIYAAYLLAIGCVTPPSNPARLIIYVVRTHQCVFYRSGKSSIKSRSCPGSHERQNCFPFYFRAVWIVSDETRESAVNHLLDVNESL